MDIKIDGLEKNRFFELMWPIREEEEKDSHALTGKQISWLSHKFHEIEVFFKRLGNLLFGNQKWENNKHLMKHVYKVLCKADVIPPGQEQADIEEMGTIEKQKNTARFIGQILLRRFPVVLEGPAMEVRNAIIKNATLDALKELLDEGVEASPSLSSPAEKVWEKIEAKKKHWLAEIAIGIYPVYRGDLAVFEPLYDAANFEKEDWNRISKGVEILIGLTKMMEIGKVEVSDLEKLIQFSSLSEPQDKDYDEIVKMFVNRPWTENTCLPAVFYRLHEDKNVRKPLRVFEEFMKTVNGRLYKESAYSPGTGSHSNVLEAVYFLNRETSKEDKNEKEVKTRITQIEQSFESVGIFEWREELISLIEDDETRNRLMEQWVTLPRQQFSKENKGEKL